MAEGQTSRQVLIGVDGSDHANNAFNWYLENLRHDGDVVHVTTVPEIVEKIGLPAFPATWSDDKFKEIIQKNKEENEKTEKMLDNYMMSLRAAKVTCKPHILSGKPGHAICEFSTKEDIGMIVVGSRGLGTISRAFMGSVSDYIVHHANCPVIIVPAPNPKQK